MAGRKIRRLTSPEVLRQIDASRLASLLHRFKEYFAGVGFPLPTGGGELEIERLAVVLADAQREAPEDLVDALFLIDQMSTKTGREAVQRVLSDASLALPTIHSHSPADVATEAWLHDPKLLSRAYASQLSTRSRTLQLLLASDGVTITDDLGHDEVRLQAKQELASRMSADADIEIFAFPYEGGVRFVVQRGGSFERYGAWNHGQSPTTVGYQPLEYCVVIYDAVHRELAVPKDPPSLQRAIREAFSIALAADPTAFSRQAVLDLGPIRTSGEGCLWCRDVPGIKHVTLRAIRTTLQHALKHTREERATNLFRAWEIGATRQPGGRLLKAEFEFEFEDCVASRAVGLSSGASIRLARDDDSELVSAWMRRRGFVLGAGEERVAAGALWEWLERPDQWLATMPEWESRLGDQHDFVRPLLGDARVVAGCIRSASGSIEHDVVTDSFGSPLLVDGNTSAIVAADPADTALWRIELGSVARAIAEAADLVGTAGQVEEASEAWFLGDFVPIAGERFPCYFVGVGDDESLRRVCAVIAGTSDQPFVLITPSRRFATPRLHDRLGASGAGWLALSECAHIEVSGRVRFRQPFFGLLRSFLAIHLPDSFGQPHRPRFPTPPGASWRDMRIRFTDAHTAAVHVRDRSQTYSYEGMGMSDKRTTRPTLQWKLLHSFAREGGILTWDSADADKKNQKRRERLANDLRAFFGIDSDPFEYVEDVKGWRTKFTIEPD